MTTHPLDLDIAILGGGIAGLWTLATLRAAGYAAILFENNQLGGAQTIASQGIIHGGIKYALTGSATRAAKAIAEMPALWQDSLNGGRTHQPDSNRQSLPDLRSARVLSDSQYLWTTPGIGSRLVGVAASKAIRTSVERVPIDQRPASLRAASPANSQTNPKFDVYRVAEPVLDVRSVIHALIQSSGGPSSCLAYDSVDFDLVTNSLAQPADARACILDSMRLHASPNALTAQSAEPPISIRASCYIFAAGAGNQQLLTQAGIDQSTHPGPAMQRRPLHMVMLRSEHLPDLFGHCTSLSDKPRITITTSRDEQGRAVWYIGGQLAEQGVSRDPASQIACAKRELHECLPWLDWDQFTDARYATWRVDRAEGLMPGGTRPDEPVVLRSGNIITAWPTKLAFAPLVARQILAMLRERHIDPSPAALAVLNTPTGPLASFRTASIAPYPWNRQEVVWTP